jgi:glycosyltransferase involved in cell wall biosynthesis
VRIAHLIGSLGRSGAAHVLAALAEDQAARGAEVTVLATGGDGPVGARLEAAGIPVRYLEKRQGIDRRMLRDLRMECGRIRPDILHTHMPGAGMWGRLARRASGGAALVVHEHSLLAYTQLRYRVAAWLLAGGEAAFLAASHEIARRAEIARRRPGAVHVLLNGVDAGRFSGLRPANGSEAPANGPESVRQKLPDPPGGVLPDASPATVVAVGRLEPRKGFPVLIDAASLLVAAGRRVRIVIAGDGPDRAALEARIRALELREIVELAGEAEDTADVLARADVFVSPSRTEGSSLALLEAMAAGVPVVATAVGGTPEIVRVTGGRTAMLVPPEHPQALADAIESYLVLDGVGGVLSARAQAGVRHALTAASRAERVYGLYEALQAGRARTHAGRLSTRRIRRLRADRRIIRECLARRDTSETGAGGGVGRDALQQSDGRGEEPPAATGAEDGTVLEVGLPRVDDRAPRGAPAVSTPELAIYARLLWTLGPHGTAAVRLRVPPVADLLQPRVEAIRREFGVAIPSIDASGPTQSVRRLAFEHPPAPDRFLESVRNWVQSG